MKSKELVSKQTTPKNHLGNTDGSERNKDNGTSRNVTKKNFTFLL